MSDRCTNDTYKGALPEGAGLAIGTALGLIGIAAAIVLWKAGLPLWLALASYVTLPPALLLALYLATRPAPRRPGRPQRRTVLAHSGGGNV